MESLLNVLKEAMLSLLILSLPISAAAQEACPTTGSEDDRIAYLKNSLESLRTQGDASQKKQEERLDAFRAKLKMEGKWSDELGSSWRNEVMSSPKFKAYQSNMDGHLNQYEASLNAFLTGEKDPEGSCIHINSTISSVQALLAEKEKQYDFMAAALLALGNLAPSNAR